ncbi:hypothetical protein [Pedobacter cryophilus]|uniref:Uncharacterized protein n=1 Tax=Pedobacter cryophilus TaxID=2571271 RepID=A0A4U1C4Q5_9SPHI|nr:hypothetical protein [Pedobacter cryophilus]TKC00292.1 hypothetical protein FA046_01010 [Pedobacter cryophilus]
MENEELRCETSLLSAAEMEQPQEVLIQLFDAQSSENFKKDLWELLKATVSNFSWTYRGEPGCVVRIQKDMLRLLEALYLLLKSREVEEGELQIDHFQLGSREQIILEREELKNLYKVFYSHTGKVKKLSLAELENPYLAIKACFQFQSLAQWQNVLAEWAEYALTQTSFTSATEDADFLVAYEYLEKMIEVAFLLGNEDEATKAKDEQQCLSYLNKKNREHAKGPVNEKLFKAFQAFVESTPAKRLNRNLRKMMLDFLHYNIGGLPVDFEDYLIDFYYLTTLLDVAEDEMNAKGGDA